jgi:hypothetical protein
LAEVGWPSTGVCGVCTEYLCFFLLRDVDVDVSLLRILDPLLSKCSLRWLQCDARVGVDQRPFRRGPMILPSGSQTRRHMYIMTVVALGFHECRQIQRLITTSTTHIHDPDAVAIAVIFSQQSRAQHLLKKRLTSLREIRRMLYPNVKILHSITKQKKAHLPIPHIHPHGLRWQPYIEDCMVQPVHVARRGQDLAEPAEHNL